MYYEGQSVRQDYKEAVKWYRKSAEQGYAGAQSNLGAMYETGQGVPKNYAMAHMFYNIAAESSHKGAVEKRNNVAEGMTASQLRKAQRLSGEWTQTHS